MTTKKKTTVLIIYTIAFYVLWAFFELIAKDAINTAIKNNYLCQFIKSGIIKNLIWTIPAITLVKHFNDDVNVSLKEMFTAKVNWLKYMPIFGVFTVYLLAGAFLRNGRLAIVEDFGIEQIIIVLFVGLTEEMVFRGWLLNATYREKNKWIYLIINSVMFLAIHFPIWIHDGIFIESFANFGFLLLIVLSLIFSYTFIRSRNLLVPVILHMYWDLLTFMFY